MTTIDSAALMPADDVVRARTPKQLRRWVLDRCDAISAATRAARQLGPFKKFYEELYPFSLFALRCYGERDDVLCVPNLDESKDYDARILGPSETITKVEITLAYPPGLHMQLRQLMDAKVVSQDEIALNHADERALHLDLVKKAAENKVRPGGYGKGYELLIFVEDSWFKDTVDHAHVSECLKRDIATLPLRFDALHVLGRTGRLYESVFLPLRKETT